MLLRSRLTFRRRPALSARRDFLRVNFRGWSSLGHPFSFGIHRLRRFYKTICVICGYWYDSSPMPNKLLFAFLISLFVPSIYAQTRPVPSPTLLQIVKAEDERRWDDVLRNLLASSNPSIRKRAALAAG